MQLKKINLQKRTECGSKYDDILHRIRLMLEKFQLLILKEMLNYKYKTDIEFAFSEYFDSFAFFALERTAPAIKFAVNKGYQLNMRDT